MPRLPPSRSLRNPSMNDINFPAGILQAVASYDCGLRATDAENHSHIEQSR